MSVPSPSRTTALATLLTDLLDERELRRLLWMAELRDIEPPESGGPVQPRSAVGLILCTVLTLDERGLIDSELRPALARLFPGSRAEIAAARTAWDLRELLAGLLSHYRTAASTVPVGVPGVEMCVRSLPSGAPIWEAMNGAPRPYEAVPDAVVARAVVDLLDADPPARAAFLERLIAARPRRADEIRGWPPADLATRLPQVANAVEMVGLLLAACSVALVRALEQRLPPVSARPPRTVMDAVAEEVDRAPRYAAPLFAALGRMRPLRGKDIAPVAALWGLPS